MSQQLLVKTDATVTDTGEDIHLLDLLTVLARHKAVVLGMPVALGALALAATFLITPVFESTAKVLPPQKQQSSGVAAVLGQLGGLAGAAGGLGGIKTPNDLYIGMLESRSIADKLIARFKLKDRYEEETMDETRRELSLHSEISNGKKDGLISIKVADEDPKFAARLANAYVEELAQLTQTLAITEASQRRAFFEKQLKDAKDQLANAEVDLRKTQEKTGMIQPAAQVGTIITTVAQLRGTIAAKEVQLNAMRTFAAGQNPQMLRTQEELRSLRAQLIGLEKNQPSREGDFMVPTGRIPEVAVEYVRRVRTVKYYETIFELLAKQFELAKIDEAEDSSMIQLLDKAVPAEKKSKPRRGPIAIAGAVGGAILGVMLAFILEGVDRSRRDPASNRRWQRFADAWNKRRPAV